MSARIRTSVLVVGLGCAQLIAWGVLFYSIAVLAEPMRAALQLTSSQVFGCFTGSLVIAGVLAPWAGRLLDRMGGRSTLAASALIGALSFAVLARAQSFTGLVLGWAIAGVAMTFGLYDACFAAIGQLDPRNYRKVVTSVTLIAGFASTVSWPLTQSLLLSNGWRTTCELYAGALLICAPIYLGVLPRLGPRPVPRADAVSEAAPPVTATTRRQARFLAWAFGGAALVGGSMSAHVVGILQALELPNERAIWVASSIGALQTFGRVVDLVFGTRRSAVQLGLFTFGALALSMMVLVAAGQAPALVYGAALLYGVANGLLTIAKATIPIELFGFEKIGTLLGTFSAPSLVMRALAPLLFAATMSAAGPVNALGALAVAACATFIAYRYAISAKAT
jgi:MFS family permease